MGTIPRERSSIRASKSESMVLRKVKAKVKERSAKVRQRVLNTISSGDPFTGHVVVAAVIGALLLVVLWGFLHNYIDVEYYSVPSPMYVFLLTRLFFIFLLVFIMGSMIWSCLQSNSDKKRP